jgi:hypothetical protein
MLERNIKCGNGNSGHNEPEALPCGGTDKTIDVQPFIAVFHRHNGALTRRGKNTSQNRFETNAMLIHCPKTTPNMLKPEGKITEL